MSVFHSSTCLVFFKGFDDFSFLGGGVVPLSAFRFSLGNPLFGVGGFAMQKATSGAKVTLMVVPDVMRVFEVEGELSNVIGSQGVRSMRQETLEFSVDNNRQSGNEVRIL